MMDLATGADFSFTLPEQVDVVHFTIKPLAEKEAIHSADCNE